MELAAPQYGVAFIRAAFFASASTPFIPKYTAECATIASSVLLACSHGMSSPASSSTRIASSDTFKSMFATDRPEMLFFFSCEEPASLLVPVLVHTAQLLAVAVQMSEHTIGSNSFY